MNIGTATRLAKGGFAVYGLDYEGHGKSDGLFGLVNKFENIVDDCFHHFSTICGQHLQLITSFMFLFKFKHYDVAHYSFVF